MKPEIACTLFKNRTEPDRNHPNNKSIHFDPIIQKVNFKFQKFEYVIVIKRFQAVIFF